MEERGHSLLIAPISAADASTRRCAMSKGKAGGAKPGAGGAAKGAADAKNDDRMLPSKEQGLFRSIVKFYETKQYKKGLKAAEQILKKFPNHGETLSMKGLTLNCLERKEEAYDFVKRGLRNDLRSHVCWHVFGLLYRSDHEYKEAIKCYLNALRLDKENIQILRDLSLLQIQMRDLTGFVETRRQLLTLRPAQRTNWIAFAVAHHLVRNYEMCLHVIHAYEKTSGSDAENAQKSSSGGDSSKKPETNEELFETSEMVLYKARVLEEGEQYDKAIDLLATKSEAILDTLGAKEALGRIYLQSGNHAQAEALYRDLIDRNPENTKYHDGLFQSMEIITLGAAPDKTALPLETRHKMIAEYEKLLESHPKCIAFVRRIIDLHSCEDDPTGSEFTRAVDVYVRPWLKKGIPSLFQSLKNLYKKRGNVALIGDLFESYERALKKDSKLPPILSSKDADSAPQDEPQAPDVLVWVLAFLAQHYDYIGRIDKAVEKVDAAIAHTPTVIELYTIKSKIMKHAGHLSSAALLSDHARELDLADRYLNCHTVKHMLRADQIDQAQRLAVLFTKDNTPANAKDGAKADPLNSLKNLHEMQCIWFEYELGKAYVERARREGFENTGRALHKFKYILKHFEDMHEDQFDFHSYCLRKMTLRSYLDMLKFEDRIFAHPFYSKGAWGAIRCYFDLHDDSPAERKKKKEAEEEAMLAKMAPNERKKYKAKQRKLAKQKEAQQNQNQQGNQSSSNKKDQDNRPFLVKEEEECQKLLYCENPLGEARKLLQKLLEYQKTDPQLDTQLLSFEWAMRSNKLLMALQAVRSALKVDRTHPEAHKAFVRLVLETQKKDNKALEKDQGGAAVHPVVEKVITNSIKEMLGACSDLGEYTKHYLETFGSASMMHAMAGVKAACMVNNKESAEALLRKALLCVQWFDPKYLDARVTTHETCETVHKTLSQDADLAGLEQEWKKVCQDHFPYSAYFEGARLKELADNPSSILVVQNALDALTIQ